MSVTLESGEAFEIATDPQAEITAFENDPMQVRERAGVLSEPYVFPAASVTGWNTPRDAHEAGSLDAGCLLTPSRD